MQKSPSTTSAEAAREENIRVVFPSVLTFRGCPKAVSTMSLLDSSDDCKQRQETCQLHSTEKLEGGMEDFCGFD